MTTVTISSYWELAQQLTSIDTTMAWCINNGLLAQSRMCSCGSACRKVARTRYPEGFVWRCPRKGCQKLLSLRDGSFFSNSNLSLQMILRILYLWSVRTPLNAVINETKASSILLHNYISQNDYQCLSLQ